MHRTGIIGVLTTAVVVLHTWACPQTAAAQALADRVSADAVVYFGLAGDADQMPAYNASVLKQYFDLAGGIDGPLADLSAILDKIAQQENDPEAQLKIAAFKRLALALWQGPTAFYLLAPAEVGQPPQITLLTAGPIQQGDLGLLLDDIPQRDQPTVSRAGDLTFVTFNPLPGGVQTAPAQQLANDPGFMAAVAGTQDNPAIVVHLDGQGLIGLVSAAVEAEAGMDQQQAWLMGRELSGILDVERILFTAGFQAKADAPEGRAAGWERNLILSLSDTPKGLLKLLVQEPIGDAELAWVPKDASMVGVTRFDATKIVDLALEIAGQVDPAEGQQAVEGAIAMGSGFVGVDLRADLIEALGSAWLTYIDPAAAGHSPLGVVAVNPLNNPDGAKRALTAIGELINAALAENMDEDVPFEIRFNTKTVNGVELNIFSAPLIMPTWAVVEDRLIVGLNPQAVLTAADRTTADPATSIMANPAFMASYRAALAGNAPTSLWWTDLPTTAPMSYQNNLIWSSLLSGFASMFSGQAPHSLLPTLSQLQPLLTPDVTLGWTDGNAFRWRSLTAFPGASAYGPTAGLTGGGTVFIGAMFTGITLPALGAARASALQVHQMSNARQIAVAQMVYANDHNNRFADHVGQLVAGGYLIPDIVVQRGTAVPAMPADQLADWSRQTSAFTLVPLPALDDIAEPHNTVLAFQHPEPGKPTVAVAFADGHAETLTVPELEARLQGQTNMTFQELTDQHRGVNDREPLAD
ncbi:MAG: hypothetical protein AAF797_17625 [Planctomycetota bacterium]